jgi:hypothetical protein
VTEVAPRWAERERQWRPATSKKCTESSNVARERGQSSAKVVARPHPNFVKRPVRCMELLRVTSGMRRAEITSLQLARHEATAVGKQREHLGLFTAEGCTGGRRCARLEHRMKLRIQ